MQENQKPPPPRLEDVPPDQLLGRIGGPVDRMEVTLRIFGDELDPAEVSDKLGCHPTEAQKRGDVIPDQQYHRVVRTGSWHLESDEAPSVNLETQITILLAKLTDDLTIWQELTKRFEVDLFCGVFLDSFNRGFELSPELLRKIADRSIKIGFDIYGR